MSEQRSSDGATVHLMEREGAWSMGRFQDGSDREPLVVYTSHGDTGLRYIIAQENEESLVLTNNELRWLVNGIFGDTDPIPQWRFWWVNLKWRLRLGR